VSLGGSIASTQSPTAPIYRSWQPRGSIVARHASTTDASTHAALYQLIMGFRATDLIAAAAELWLADELADRPSSSRELAERVAAHPDALGRVLRALAHLGIVAVVGDQCFALTPLGQYLRTTAQDSLHPTARFWGLEYNRRPWLHLPHTLRTGETAFDHVFDMNWIDYLTAHPQVAATFNNGMTGLTSQVTAAVLARYDFGACRTIVDVGGGNGHLLVAILQAFPDLSGTVFDLPHCRSGALQYLATAGVAGRCEFVGGDFFTTIPAGADAYLLKWVIHDWDDSRSIAILRTCRRAMAPGSRLLIIERLLPSGNEAAPDAVFGDITMLVHTGGRERTEAEFRILLEAADLCLARTIATTTPYSLLEALSA
jgi:hypothetical protein